MKKIFKNSLFIIAILFACIFSLKVNAMSINDFDQNDIIKNKIGTKIPRHIYISLENKYDIKKINSITTDELNEILKHYSLPVEEYIATTTYFDSKGNVIDSIDKVITEKEALEIEKNQKIIPAMTYQEKRLVSTPKVSYETNAKKIYMYVEESSSSKIVTFFAKWKNTPNVKKFDVIGLRTEGSASINFYWARQSGWDSSGYDEIRNQWYESSSSNFKSTSKGIGMSMNLFDDTYYHELTIAGYVYNYSNKKIAGSYQHATNSSITLAQSKSYSFSSSGYGGVFKFSNSVASKYDGMKGIYYTL